MAEKGGEDREARLSERERGVWMMEGRMGEDGHEMHIIDAQWHKAPRLM